MRYINAKSPRFRPIIQLTCYLKSQLRRRTPKTVAILSDVKVYPMFYVALDQMIVAAFLK